jgi:hypothetical protein
MMPLTLSDADRAIAERVSKEAYELPTPDGEPLSVTVRRCDEAIYLAGKRAGIEEAAKVCEGAPGGYLRFSGQEFAAAIRAMLEPQAEE